ncbi:MAG: DNA topoisomerase 4 subunit A [Proteobacteria bacterium]|nr:DNA topoisomerase 4 subunit A [Pseudomonadota bacterium]
MLTAARERYLNYALSVITARALPDVRDGLKPVQRRILYAMYSNLRLLHTARFRKSAAVVGEVMARFHPHGDQSIYDAMVRLAQPFSLRYPLVDGHGNFGSLDGDGAAAMRYTECRLQAVSAELIKEISMETVGFKPNYDGTTEEPIVLPSRVPNLLTSGVTGIAVGMATHIPPHNLREVCRAAVAMIDDPAILIDGLLEHVGGPDFPCGGEILNSAEELKNIYETGRGPVRLRATWTEERHNRRRYIVIDSIPYMQNKATLVQQIGDLIRDNKVPQLVDVRDESTDDIRVVCELKRGASDVAAMAFLFKNTNLRTNFHVNMTVLLPTENPEIGTPAQVGLHEVLRQFLDFRLDVTRKRHEYQLRKLLKRIHILRGFAVLFDALDEAIALIRASDGKADAARRLMARFPLDELQTDAILELKLYRLAKLEIDAVLAELAELEAEAARIQAILDSEKALWGIVRADLLDVADKHGDERRTQVGAGAVELEFDPSKYIVEKNTWVIVTRDGWIKRQKGFTDLTKVRVRDGDAIDTVIRCSTRSSIAIFGSSGRCFVVLADDIEQTSGYGKPIQTTFALADGEEIVAVLSTDPRNLPSYRIPPRIEDDNGQLGLDVGLDTDPGTPPEGEGAAEELPAAEDEVGPVAVAISKGGKGLLLPLKAHSEPSTKNGRRYMSVGGADGVVGVVPLTHPDTRVALATLNGRVILFLAESLKLLMRSGKGVNAIRISRGDRVLDFKLLTRPSHSLGVQTNRGRDVLVWERKYKLTNRGGKGFEVIKLGTLQAIPRDPVVIDPYKGEEPEDELTDDEIEDELAAGGEAEGGSDE